MTTPAKTPTFKRILWGLAAALTTPEAVKAEKSLATIALTRLAILLPSAAIVVTIVVKALGG